VSLSDQQRVADTRPQTFANLLISTVQGGANTVLKGDLKRLDGTVDRAITCYSPDGGRKAKRVMPWAA